MRGHITRHPIWLGSDQRSDNRGETGERKEAAAAALEVQKLTARSTSRYDRFAAAAVSI